MNRIMSGKKVELVLSRLGDTKANAIQQWVNYELDQILSKYEEFVAFSKKNISIIDNRNADGVCAHCKNYNIRFMLEIEDIKSTETTNIAFSVDCLSSFFNGDTEKAERLYNDIKVVIKARSSLLERIRDEEYKEFRYPNGMRVNKKIDVLVNNNLPVPDLYTNEVRLAVTTQKILHDKTHYFVKYQRYIRYVRLSLKLQPYSSFLLSVNEKMKKTEPLSTSMMDALERGMGPGWEERLKQSIDIKESNIDIMNEYEQRLNKLLMCRLGFTKNTVISFRKQLRNGRPLSDKQVDTLKEWEEKFSKQLEEIGENFSDSFRVTQLV